MSTTSSPRSRNHSAIRVAVKAARIRTIAGASEVATTTTERAMPSGPRSRSMNSATSRPRSPISATTETFASVPRAIIDSSDDLPTPDPAKMPNRWPLPHGIEAVEHPHPERAAARSTRPLRSGWGGRPSTLTSCPRRGGPPSIGRPRPSSTRPRSLSPTTIERGRPTGVAGVPARSPVVSPRATHTALPSLQRDHLGLQRPVVGQQHQTVTDRGGHAADPDGHAHHLVHLAIGPRPGRGARRSGQLLEHGGHGAAPLRAAPDDDGAHPLEGPRTAGCRWWSSRPPPARHPARPSGRPTTVSGREGAEVGEVPDGGRIVGMRVGRRAGSVLSSSARARATASRPGSTASADSRPKSASSRSKANLGTDPSSSARPLARTPTGRRPSNGPGRRRPGRLGSMRSRSASAGCLLGVSPSVGVAGLVAGAASRRRPPSAGIAAWHAGHRAGVVDRPAGVERVGGGSRDAVPVVGPRPDGWRHRPPAVVACVTGPPRRSGR